MWMFLSDVLSLFAGAQFFVAALLLELIRLPVELLSVILGNCPDRA